MRYYIKDALPCQFIFLFILCPPEILIKNLNSKKKITYFYIQRAEELWPKELRTSAPVFPMRTFNALPILLKNRIIINTCKKIT